VQGKDRRSGWGGVAREEGDTCGVGGEEGVLREGVREKVLDETDPMTEGHKGLGLVHVGTHESDEEKGKRERVMSTRISIIRFNPVLVLRTILHLPDKSRRTHQFIPPDPTSQINVFSPNFEDPTVLQKKSLSDVFYVVYYEARKRVLQTRQESEG
jgi:hypothetical protein